MKKFLLPEKGNFYKANLHCHSTCSDGQWTPEELKEQYMKQGYSIIAYTDHHVMYNHSYLTDENFLALLGYEADVSVRYRSMDKRGGHMTCHLCYISLTPENTQVCYHGDPHGYVEKNAERFPKETEFFRNAEIFEREYTPRCINEMIRRGREAGYFVTYNHPHWSMERYPDYMEFEGMNALEIFNYSGYAYGYNDYAPDVYDDMLCGGKRIYCIAADDNHDAFVHPSTKGDPFTPVDSFGGFTVIKADNLKYETITKAMLDGNFYASMGPEIKALWFEDGYVHIECSEAERIAMSTGVRAAKSLMAKDGKLLTEAAFPVKPEWKFVRITVTDCRGKDACTNAYFTDGLFAE
ncbi:MAG: PHP domain-containing protein [Lachnospiraceae bacterium]|nr:PHP domain-containing protein [Lachnospiraceae bacterium]